MKQSSKNNEMKSWVFKKINKMDKPQLRLSKGEEKTQNQMKREMLQLTPQEYKGLLEIITIIQQYI